jgi:DNA-binding response OmpR family regulator
VTTGDGSRYCVVVAEDDMDLRLLMEERIRGDGHEVIAVPDGAALLAAIQRGDVSLAVTDLVMPRLNGAQVIRVVRAANDATPFILVTALPAFIPEDIIELGGVTILCKPFGLHDLAAAVSASLESAAHMAERRGATAGPTIEAPPVHPVMGLGPEAAPPPAMALEATVTRDVGETSEEPAKV